MSLPFVSRSEYQFVCLQRDNERVRIAELKASLVVADSRAEIAETRLQDLMEKYHALRFQRVEGTTAVVAVDAPAAALPIAREPDELRALVAEVCGTDTRKRALMLRQLAADRAAKRNPDDIRRDILHGVSSDGVPV